MKHNHWNTFAHPHSVEDNSFAHIWLVQGPAKPELDAMRADLGSSPNGDKAYLLPANRINFWFEGPHQTIKHFVRDHGKAIHVLMPYEVPQQHDGKLDLDLEDAARKQGITFVPVPKDILDAAKWMDNAYVKPHAHGSNLASEYKPANFSKFKEFSEIMATAAETCAVKNGMDPRKLIVNVQNKYFFGVPSVLRRLHHTAASVITYFSHIPLIATSKPEVFNNVNQEVRELYAGSLAQCDVVYCHSPAQSFVFGKFVQKTLPHIQHDEEASILTQPTRTAELKSIFLGIDGDKWRDIIRGEKAWKVAAEVMEAIGDRRSATIYGRLDVFKGLEIAPLIVERLLDRYPEFTNDFVFTNVYGRVNPALGDQDPFSAQLKEIGKVTGEVDERLKKKENPPTQSPFLKFELTDPDGTKREFLSQAELGGLMIATMLTQGVAPVTSTEEGLHMGVFEFMKACSYYLLENPQEFKNNCVKYLGMSPNDPRIESASIVPWVSCNSGAAHYLKEEAGNATLIMDPKDIEMSADTLAAALRTPRSQRLEMLERVVKFMDTHTPADWVSGQMETGETLVKTRAYNDQAHAAQRNAKSLFRASAAPACIAD